MRSALGWSREEVAARAGVTLRTVGRVERGERLANVQLGTVARIAAAVGVSCAELVPALAIVQSGGRTP